MKGRHHTPEARAKISAGNRGKVVTDETRARLKEAHAARSWANIPEHGTTARYKGSRIRPACHCDECRAAWRDYIRLRNKDKTARERAS